MAAFASGSARTCRGVLAEAAREGRRRARGEARLGVELVGHVEQEEMGRAVGDQGGKHPIMLRAFARRERPLRHP